MARLTPCESCQRHISSTERACPFCSAGLPLALAAALLLGACQKSPREEPELKPTMQAQSDAGMLDAGDVGTRRAVYGAPPPRPSARCNCAPNDPLCSCE